MLGVLFFIVLSVERWRRYKAMKGISLVNLSLIRNRTASVVTYILILVTSNTQLIIAYYLLQDVRNHTSSPIPD